MSAPVAAIGLRRGLSASLRAPAEAGWLVGVAGCMAVVCAAPYVVAAVLGPPDLERLGTFWFVRDFSQYQAAMREGARSSSWLIHNHFSTEPHAAALMYPLYVAAGKAAALMRVDPLALFAVLEWLGRLALLVALYAFGATFTAHRGQRRLALLLAAGTLGFGALFVPLRLAADALGFEWLRQLIPDAIDIYLEINSFGLFMAGPHLMFGMALTLVCGVLYLRTIGGDRGWLAPLVVAMVGLSLVHPFNLPVLLSVFAVHAAWSGRRAWTATVASVAAAVPMLVYSLAVFQADPFWSGTYASQNQMPSPAPWELAIDLGILLVTAPLAWPIVRVWPADRRRLLLVWVALGLVWMYAPVPYQRRLGFGVQPALAVLAAVGLAWLQTWLAGRGIAGLRRRLVNDGIVALALSTSILVYVLLLASAARNEPAEVYLWTRSEANAAAWLGERTSAADVVLASTEFSNPLVGSIDGRVVHGHIVATLDSDAKASLVRRFYATDTRTEERTALLEQSGATVVALGPRERALGVTDLRGQPELELIFDRYGVQLFRVLR